MYLLVAAICDWRGAAVLFIDLRYLTHVRTNVIDVLRLVAAPPGSGMPVGLVADSAEGADGAGCVPPYLPFNGPGLGARNGLPIPL